LESKGLSLTNDGLLTAHAPQFLPRDAMHSADYVVRDVCLPITRWYCIETAEHISKVSHCRAVQSNHSSFSVSNVTVIFRRDPPNRGVKCKGSKKIVIFGNISFHLENDTRQSHNYYEIRIENHTQAFEWYYFQRPRTRPVSRSRSRKS